MNDLPKGLKRAKKVKWISRPEVLLDPNIPKPMHGTAPREILGSKWWNATRKAAYASTGYCCIACKVHKSEARFRTWLEGHELYAIDYPKGRMVYLETIPLCHCCHAYIHSGRLEALLGKGQIAHAKYVIIIRHGDKVLREAELVKPADYEGPVAAWEDWRLVINGQEHEGQFKTFQEWKEHYAQDS